MKILMYEEFRESCRSGLEARLQDGVTVTLCSVRKNNNVFREGFVIRDGINDVGPIFYLEPYYRQYATDHDLEAAICRLTDDYLNSTDNKPVPVEGFLTDFNRMKGQIAAVLVNKDTNKELLETCPFTEFLDLVLIYRAFILDDSGELGSCIITNEFLHLWGITEQELKQIADDNAGSFFTPIIKSMSDVLAAYGKEGGLTAMYVISNQYDFYGAACALYPRVLENLAEQFESDLILLPSSIHEFLILPCVEIECEVTDMSEIVKEVNQMVSQEDILCDHAYLYDRAKKEICSV